MAKEVDWGTDWPANRLAMFRSVANPTQVHSVEIQGWKLTCTCSGYKYRKRCWHITTCKDKMAEES